MGRADDITKLYLDNPVVYADAFNKYIFHGHQVIKPEDLQEIDATELLAKDQVPDQSTTSQQQRDLLRRLVIKTDGRNTYCLLGIENQTYIDYGMVIRVLQYDAMRLSRQMQRLINQHKEDKDYCRANFLSGLLPSDRIMPVITLVIYFGSDPWDAPVYLHELYECQEPVFLEYAVDYKLNLIAPALMSDAEIDEFQTGLALIMHYAKRRHDKQALKALLLSDSRFAAVDSPTADVINTVYNARIKYPEGKEIVDMRDAIDEMLEDRENETILKVIINMLNAHFPYEAISSATTWPVEKIAAVAKEKGLAY